MVQDRTLKYSEMKNAKFYHYPLLLLIAVFLNSCSFKPQKEVYIKPVPPIAPEKWQEIQEDLWSASCLARSEAVAYTQQAMTEWMGRVREKTDSEFIPWYTSYWAQQWIGFKVGWYKMSRDEDEPSIEEYLVEYIREEYYELVLEPVNEISNPQQITEQAAALYISLLAEQLQRLPAMHRVSVRSLRKKLEPITLVSISASGQKGLSLSLLLERNNLNGMPAYDALLTHADSVATRENSSPGRDNLQIVVDDTVARMVADLSLRAGGAAASMVLGPSLGLIFSAGITAFSISSHEQEKPEIERQLRQALEAGLKSLWQRLMEDPVLGVLLPINHMSSQIEILLFPIQATETQ